MLLDRGECLRFWLGGKRRENMIEVAVPFSRDGRGIKVLEKVLKPQAKIPKARI